MFSSRGRRLAFDDAGVSEVIGFILIFGITSMVLVGAMLGFNIAKANTVERAVEVQLDTLSQSVANHFVDAALFVGEHNSGTGVNVTHRLKLDLPFNLEGFNYRIDLEPDAINLTVLATEYVASASLFRVGDESSLEICDVPPVNGGPIELIITYRGSGEAIPAECVSIESDTRLIYIQEAP